MKMIIYMTLEKYRKTFFQSFNQVRIKKADQRKQYIFIEKEAFIKQD